MFSASLFASILSDVHLPKKNLLEEEDWRRTGRDWINNSLKRLFFNILNNRMAKKAESETTFWCIPFRSRMCRFIQTLSQSTDWCWKTFEFTLWTSNDQSMTTANMFWWLASQIKGLSISRSRCRARGFVFFNLGEGHIAHKREGSSITNGVAKCARKKKSENREANTLQAHFQREISFYVASPFMMESNRFWLFAWKDGEKDFRASVKNRPPQKREKKKIQFDLMCNKHVETKRNNQLKTKRREKNSRSCSINHSRARSYAKQTSDSVPSAACYEQIN